MSSKLFNFLAEDKDNLIHIFPTDKRKREIRFVPGRYRALTIKRKLARLLTKNLRQGTLRLQELRSKGGEAYTRCCLNKRGRVHRRGHMVVIII